MQHLHCEYSLLLTLSITHTCQFTTISTVEQPELLPKPNTKRKMASLQTLDKQFI